MAISKIENTRIKTLNSTPARADGEYVLYWMQQSQRAEHNPALEHAARVANASRKPLLVAFGLMDDYPEANARHYRFMLDGFPDIADALERRNITFVVQHGHPADVAIRLGARAHTIVCDRGYLRHQKAWRARVAEEAGCKVVQVEGDVVVPVEVASPKREYAARTLRPRIHRHWDDYLVELSTTAVKHGSLDLDVDGLDLSDIDQLFDSLKLDRSVPPNPDFKGGTLEAKRLFNAFLRNHFSSYDANRNQPQTDDVSHMSKYLHFGQISPVWLALRVLDARPGSADDRNSFLEEMIVRRELSMNFCEYDPDYDNFNCLPDWAQKTLREHADDDRPHCYTRKQLEDAETHDPYWNAAMREMRYTGYMHNYMRMYWGKKILEWCNTPEYAYKTVLELNNTYFIDGRDPNSYTGVAWIFGNHDRGWFEREIFGKVRYMAASGLERKCDIDGYVRKVDALVEAASGGG